ncbi:hypothetical protein GQX74_015170 [Glossina fuscipes]|nr:hypothetical protein GQX74_015170 [Glossina fuscipes]
MSCISISELDDIFKDNCGPRDSLNIRFPSKQFLLIFERGQLKTKNGQKYVFNGRPSGIFVSRTCAIFTAIITILILIFTILITYFVTVNTVPSGCTNGHYVPNTQIAAPFNVSPVTTASMLGMPMPKNKYQTISSPVGDIPPDNDVFGENKGKFIDRKLQLYEGWTPLHYNTQAVTTSMRTSREVAVMSSAATFYGISKRSEANRFVHVIK